MGQFGKCDRIEAGEGIVWGGKKKDRIRKGEEVIPLTRIHFAS